MTSFPGLNTTSQTITSNCTLTGTSGSCGKLSIIGEHVREDARMGLTTSGE